MEISYDNNIISKENVPFIAVIKTQKQPNVVLTQQQNKYSSLFMYAPNAVVGIMVHWLILNIPINDPITKGETKKEYHPPSPPKGSGKHNYMFKLYTHDQPLNITSDSVNNYEKVLKVLTSNGVSEVKTLSFISENANEKSALGLGGGKKNRKQKKTIKNKTKLRRTKLRRTKLRRTKMRRTKLRRTKRC